MVTFFYAGYRSPYTGLDAGVYQAIHINTRVISWVFGHGKPEISRSYIEAEYFRVISGISPGYLRDISYSDLNLR